MIKNIMSNFTEFQRGDVISEGSCWVRTNESRRRKKNANFSIHHFD